MKGMYIMTSIVAGVLNLKLRSEMSKGGGLVGIWRIYGSEIVVEKKRACLAGVWALTQRPLRDRSLFLS